MKLLRLLTLCFIVTGHVQVFAMPAYPKKIAVQTDNGIVYVRLYGDEHNKWAETTDGYAVIQKASQWYYADQDATGTIIPSKYKLSPNPDAETKQFLSTVSRNMSTAPKREAAARQYSRAQSASVVGDRKVLVILMEYTDLAMVNDSAAFNHLFNSLHYSVDGAQGSVRDFYTDVSYGQLNLVSDVIGPFKSKYERSYYGGNDRNGDDSHPEVLFEEAIKHAAELVTLKDYDSDHDGYLDNVHIIFAGHGEEAGASDDAIWSHEALFYRPYEIQGVKIDRYSCAPELRGNKGNGISRIGPHCHEIGHALGAMDYYDTDYSSDGEFYGTGDWDVMAGGSWNNDGISPADFNPYVKAYDFGWITPKPLPSGDVTITPSCYDPNNYYILQSSDSEDLYLVENRNRDKWGAGVPGKGLLFFHIHPDIAKVGNQINSSAPQKCYIVCASSRNQRPGTSPNSYGDIDSDGCPYPGRSGNKDFGQTSIPAAFFWDTDECGIEINNITEGSNGAIHLTNNSIYLEGSTTERQRLYFEGFENDSVQIAVEEGSAGTPKWQVESNSKEPSKFVSRPSAYAGIKSLQLSAKRVSESAQSTLRLKFKEPEPVGQIKLKLYINSLSPQADNPNLVRIGYSTDENGSLEFTEITSSQSNHWVQTVIEIPNNIYPQIVIEGIAYSGSVLAIDNIEIEQIVKSDETSISSPSTKACHAPRYYSINGVERVQKQKGINLARQADGTVKKVYIK